MFKYNEFTRLIAILFRSINPNFTPSGQLKVVCHELGITVPPKHLLREFYRELKRPNSAPMKREWQEETIVRIIKYYTGPKWKYEGSCP